MDQHGLFQAKFTEDGTLAYSGAMADQDAADEAQLKAIEHLEAAGWLFRDLTAATTCMDDIKIKRRF